MKIAITGSTAGIGQALANILSQRGHDVVGLSRRTGYNIRNIPKLIDKIKDCDLFINNAQAGYAQTELLFEIFKTWQNEKNKKIWVISTDMTRFPTAVDIPDHSLLDVIKYRNQKIALEEACRQLQFLNLLDILIIRPGAVATQPNQVAGVYPYCDVDHWAITLADLLTDLSDKGYSLREFSLTASKSKINL